MAIYNNFCFSFFADFLYSHIFSHNSGWHIKLYYKEQLTPDWYSTTHAPEISTLTAWYSASHRNERATDRRTTHPASLLSFRSASVPRGQGRISVATPLKSSHTRSLPLQALRLPSTHEPTGTLRPLAHPDEQIPKKIRICVNVMKKHQNSPNRG